MALPNESQIRHIASMAGLTETWCCEALRLLAVEDVSGLVASELNRLRKSEATRAAGRDAPKRDEKSMRDALEQRVHHAYAAKIIRPLLLESISLACWESLVGYAVKDRRFGAEVTKPEKAQDHIGRQLGVDGTNLRRWRKQVTLPDGDKVLGAALIVLEDEVADVGFADRKTLVKQAVFRTVGYIRERHGEKGNNDGERRDKRVERLPTAEELYVVRAALRDKRADDLLPLDDADPRAGREGQNELYGRVLDGVGGLFPAGQIREAEDVRGAIASWAMPYALLRVALVSGWPDGTEDEWNWGEVDENEPAF